MTRRHPARRLALALLASALLFEGLCRTGLVPNRRQALAAERAVAGRPSVTVLGDSFSIETGNPATTRLRRHLSHLGLATVNLAAPGMGPTDYLAQPEDSGPTPASRLVIVNYYVGNDLTDTLSLDAASSSSWNDPGLRPR